MIYFVLSTLSLFAMIFISNYSSVCLGRTWFVLILTRVIFSPVLSTMSCSIKLLVLVAVCLYLQATLAKRYDFKFCWSQSEFEAILDSQCLNRAFRRGIEKGGLYYVRREFHGQ